MTRPGSSFIRGEKDITSTWEGKDLPKGGSIRHRGCNRHDEAWPRHIYIHVYLYIQRSADRHLPRIAAMIFPASESPSPFSFAFLSPGRGAQQAWNPANFLPFAPSPLPTCPFPHPGPSLFPYPFPRPRNNNRREKEIKGALSTLFPSLTYRVTRK